VIDEEERRDERRDKMNKRKEMRVEMSSQGNEGDRMAI
jgi:hypothetical protein